METGAKKILYDRLMEAYDRATEEERRIMTSLYITEMDERTRRSYVALWGGKEK